MVKHAGGRPTKYDPKYVRQAEKLCRLGATDMDLANFFEVSIATIKRWTGRYPEFRTAQKVGNGEPDDRVARSLYQRAIGFAHPDVHVSSYQGAVKLTPITKHYAPDTTACIFWLKNRRPDLWRDVNRTEVTGADGGPVQQSVDLAALSDEDLAVVERLAAKLPKREPAPQ